MDKRFVKFRVSEPIYGSVIRVVIGGDWNELVKSHYKPSQAPTELDGANGRYWSSMSPKGKLERHLWVSEFGSGIIAHEVFHACFSILSDKGISPITVDNEETLAYLLGYYTRIIISKAYSLGADKLTQYTTS